jgi:hypothetical protein
LSGREGLGLSLPPAELASTGFRRFRGVRKVDRTRDASGHTRSDTSGRRGSLLDSNRTLALSRPVVAWSASGRCFAGVRCCAIGASGRLGGAFGRLGSASGRLGGASGHGVLTVGAVTVGGSDTVERVRSVSTGASGRPEKYPVKGDNGSIRLGCL